MLEQWAEEQLLDHHSWHRVSNPLYYVTIHFFSIFFQPLPDSPISPTLFVVLFLWLNVSSCHIYCFLLNDIMGINFSHLGTQNTQGPIDWHKHINIYYHHLWIVTPHCTLYFLYWGPQCISFSKITLCRCHISAH